MSTLGHERLTRIRRDGNRLLIAGHPAADLVAMAGGSPCYVYDREALSERVGHWRALMPEGLSLHYAIKANPMPALVAHMASQVDGLDVASLQEMQVALSSGKSAE